MFVNIVACILGSNLSCTKEDDFYGNDNTFEQTHVENSCMTATLTLQTESTRSS